VTVMEGRVALELEPGKATSTVSSTLAAGEQALITGGTIVKSLHVNVAAVTAWIQGELEFDETPLSEAVVEFNRYSRKRLIITSPALTEVRVSGVYSPSDTDSLLLFLRNQPDLAVTETDTEIRIDKK